MTTPSNLTGLCCTWNPATQRSQKALLLVHMEGQEGRERNVHVCGCEYTIAENVPAGAFGAEKDRWKHCKRSCHVAGGNMLAGGSVN